MLVLALLPMAFPCDWFIYDDYADGSADGRVYGGTFVSGGWRPDGGTIVYDLPDVVSGYINMRVSNIDESGVAQHDLLEMFSDYDGSFSDSRRDNFLQVKFAGDIYEGYDGRVKLQAGPEWYGDYEAGGWTSEYDWQASNAYDFTVSWGGTTAAMDIASTLSTSIDYSGYGVLSFRTLRIPNDTSYTRDYQMDDIVIAGVSLCGESGTATSPSDTDTDTDTDSDADTDADTDTDADADSDADTDTDTDADTGSATSDPPISAPYVTSFDVQPREITQGEPWNIAWANAGAITALEFCFAGHGQFESCAELSPTGTSAKIPTSELSAGQYTAWIVAEGPGGEGKSGELLLTINAAAPAATCGFGVPAGAFALVISAALSVGLRKRALPARPPGD